MMGSMGLLLLSAYRFSTLIVPKGWMTAYSAHFWQSSRLSAVTATEPVPDALTVVVVSLYTGMPVIGSSTSQ